MRISKLGFFTAAASVLLACAAYAVPVTGTAVPPSALSLSIGAGPLGTASGSGMITGTTTADATVTTTTFSTTGGSGSFSVANFSASGLALGTISLEDFHITVTLPASTTTTGGPTVFSPDLGGTAISVDNGFVIQGGSATLFNFSTSPTIVTAPAGSLTTLDLVAQTWTIPFATTSTLSTLGIPVEIVIGADLVLQIVPEPGTLFLLGAGVAALLVTSQHRRA